MNAFDHVLTLLSFVFALGLTHLLSRVANLIVQRERVRFSGLLGIAILNAVAILFTNWLQIWDLRNAAQWDLSSITVLFLFAVAIYFLCATAAPESGNDGTIDMEAYYWSQRVPFYALVVICMFLAMGANVVFLKTPNAKLFFEENAATLPFFIPPLLAIAVRAPWAQWAAGIGLLILTIVFAVAFSSVLH